MRAGHGYARTYRLIWEVYYFDNNPFDAAFRQRDSEAGLLSAAQPEERTTFEALVLPFFPGLLFKASQCKLADRLGYTFVHRQCF
jgi:hypothetical protein